MDDPLWTTYVLEIILFSLWISRFLSLSLFLSFFTHYLPTNRIACRHLSASYVPLSFSLFEKRGFLFLNRTRVITRMLVRYSRYMLCKIWIHHWSLGTIKYTCISLLQPRIRRHFCDRYKIKFQCELVKIGLGRLEGILFKSSFLMYFYLNVSTSMLGSSVFVRYGRFSV